VYPSYQINVTRNTKLTQGNVIKFHFSLMKYMGIPLLTRRQAIAGKYEKSAITIKDIKFIRNTINDESNTT